MRTRGAALLAAALFACTAPAAAQAPGCTYSRCALLHSGGMLARGGTAQSAGVFLVGLEALATSPEPVRREYQASIRHGRRARVLTTASLAALMGAVAYRERRTGARWSSASGIGLPLAAVAFGAAGGREWAREGAHLERAIWLYNGALPPDSGRTPMGCAYDRCGLRMRGLRVVRGDDAEVVGLVGSPPVAALFAAAGGEARALYDSSGTVVRRTAPWRRWAGRAGLAGVAGTVVSDAPAVEGISLALMLVGYAVGHPAMQAERRARYDLEQAVWYHNRDLPRASGPDPLPGVSGMAP